MRRAGASVTARSVLRCRGATRTVAHRRLRMDVDRPLPSPMTPEAKPFWDGLRESKLRLPKCGACGHVFFYPRILCPKCHARDIGWIEASGKGKLHAFEISRSEERRVG